jgi:hypothetical protein
MLPAVVSAARGAAARSGERRNRTASSKGDFGSEGSYGKWRAFLVAKDERASSRLSKVTPSMPSSSEAKDGR